MLIIFLSHPHKEVTRFPICIQLLGQYLKIVCKAISEYPNILLVIAADSQFQGFLASH